MKRLFTLFFAVMAMALSVGCSQIDTGNVGVVTTLGKINNEELPQGGHLTWFAGVDEFTTKEVPMSLSDMRPKAQDNLTIADLDVDIYFKPNPALVAETVSQYKGDVFKYEGDLVAGFNRISREARESVYRAVSEFKATTMHTKRTELAARIQEILQSELNRSDKDKWTITNVNVRNLVTDPAIEASIRQAAETDQAIARAVKEQELARVEADRMRVKAQGEADANRIIAASLTQQLIRLKEIEAQQAFAKQGTHTVLMGQSGGALVNVGK